MSRLEDLIAELCPNGVAYKTLLSVASYREGAAHEHIMKPEVGRFIVCKVKFISSDSAYKMYSDKRLSPADNGDVIMVMSDVPNGKSLAKCFFIEEDGLYTINQRVCVLTANQAIVIPKFLYYVLNRNKQLLEYDNGLNQTHLKKKWILDIKIPVPPIPIQTEIVKKLDSFKTYIANLITELGLRNQQFKAYSTIMFNENKKEDAVAINDICLIVKGRTAIQKAVPGKYPLVVTTPERKTSTDFQFEEPSVCIPLVSSRGHGVASLNHVYYQEGKFALGNILCALTPKNHSLLLAKYLYYYFEQTKDYTLVPLMKGGANVALRIDDIMKVKIPVPSVEKQRRIVEILQIFDEYCNNALPAEIAARQKQYEYYRDKLLSFGERKV